MTDYEEKHGLIKRKVNLVVERIKQEIKSQLHKVLGEVNDSTTRAYLVNQINYMMLYYKYHKTIYNYKVICDETNNGSNNIDRGELTVTVLFQQSIATSIIRLDCKISYTGVSFEELPYISSSI